MNPSRSNAGPARDRPLVVRSITPQADAGTDDAIGPPATVEGRLVQFFKPGTAPDALGYWYLYGKDAGVPGAWSPGTPGLAGRATNGTAAGDAGCLPLWTPAAGNELRLTRVDLSATAAHLFALLDVLWVNSGLVVTQTTAQTVNSVALPARATSAPLIGLLFTAAATNAAVNNSATVSYTNQAGTPGRTATLAALIGAQIPATPVIGTVVWFSLAAGDTGAVSIQSVTLGTSLATGSVSLLMARVLWMQGVAVAGAAPPPIAEATPGVSVGTGACPIWALCAASATAATINGAATIVERTP